MGYKHKACISLEVQRGLKIKRRSGGKGFADPNTFFFPKQSKKDHRPRASWARAPQFHIKQIKFVNCTVCYIFHVDKNPLESVGRKEMEPFNDLPLERKELLHRMTARHLVYIACPREPMARKGLEDGMGPGMGRAARAAISDSISTGPAEQSQKNPLSRMCSISLEPLRILCSM